MAGPDVSEAVRRIAAGEVVAFPTETVYGLGADATNEAAVGKIFALKERPEDHPLIVHIGAPEQVDDWALHVPETARRLVRSFWPGPLTLVLRKSARVPARVTGGQATVGLRCPSHPVAQELLRRFGQAGSGALAAPSANKFGHVSATTAQHVRDEFGDQVFILDGGECEVGLESTIVDLSSGAAVLLRPGAVSREDLARVLGTRPHDRGADAPRAPGTLAAHYAPRTALVLAEPETLAAELTERANIAVLAMSEPPPTARVTSWITLPADPREYGRALYRSLRSLDASGAKRIVVEAPPNFAEWEAVNDRLARAAAGGGILDDET